MFQEDDLQKIYTNKSIEIIIKVLYMMKMTNLDVNNVYFYLTIIL